MQIFTNRGADGPSDVFKYSHGREEFNIIITGSFGSGTITLESLSPSGNWLKVKDISLTSDVMITMKSYPSKYRLWLEGSVAPNINAWVIGTTTIIKELQTHSAIVDSSGSWITLRGSPVVRQVVYT